MASFLITGSNGFIGTHLIFNLSKKHKIIGISNLKQNPKNNFIPIKKDITKIDTSDIRQKVSTIIHLAALSNIEFCEKNPKTCFHTNVIGTLKMLEVAKKKKLKFIFLSTSHIYGRPNKLPISEGQKNFPTSIYSSSKILGERLCEIYAKEFGLNITILRLFSVYGPGCPNHNVILKIIQQLLNKRTIVLGNISSKRDFIFVNDLIDAIESIVKKQKTGFNIYNICSGKSYSIKSIIEKLSKISGKRPKIKIKNTLYRKNDVPEIKGSFAKIKRDYRWKPATSLELGLEQTLNYYNNL